MIPTDELHHFSEKNTHALGDGHHSIFSSGKIPSGKHTENYGNSQLFMGKSTISMAIFNSKLLVYQRVYIVTKKNMAWDDGPRFAHVA